MNNPPVYIEALILLGIIILISALLLSPLLSPSKPSSANSSQQSAQSAVGAVLNELRAPEGRGANCTLDKECISGTCSRNKCA